MHSTGYVEENKHYMQFFGEDEWLKEIGEVEDSGSELDSRLEGNNSHDDSESNNSELNSFEDSHDDSESDGLPTFVARKTLPADYINETTPVPIKITQKKVIV